ncbi:hypothetical protein ACN20G_08675 [Streptomyces sp. BI20]|uniref:hypothetical protein n=1 Tax=Streptomyces sp. BI20 TaxID=3403460 RepID=UPI003C777B4C
MTEHQPPPHEGAPYDPAPPGAAPPGPIPGPPGPTPDPGAVPHDPAGPLLALGDIQVVGDQILTPAGPIPLRGSVWTAADLSHTEEKIPQHAIVLAVVFGLLCLVGVLFLLMREKRTTGYIQVSVFGGGRQYTTMIPAFDDYSFPWVMARVEYGRALSAA